MNPRYIKRQNLSSLSLQIKDHKIKQKQLTETVGPLEGDLLGDKEGLADGLGVGLTDGEDVG